MPRQRNGGFATACRRRYYQDAPSLRSPARGGRRQGSERNRSKTRGVIAGLVPAISIRMAQCPIIGMAGTSPAMTRGAATSFAPVTAERSNSFKLLTFVWPCLFPRILTNLRASGRKAETLRDCDEHITSNPGRLLSVDRFRRRHCERAAQSAAVQPRGADHRERARHIYVARCRRRSKIKCSRPPDSDYQRYDQGTAAGGLGKAAARQPRRNGFERQ